MSSIDAILVIALEWFAIVFLVGMSGLFSGLNLGLMGLDPMGLEIVLASDRPDDVMAAKKIKPLRDRGNWLLCTLLLGNVAVNAALSILLADKAGGLAGFLVSTAIIVAFGEIIPQAICSRYALYIGAKTVWIVWFLMVCMAVLAWPISWLLDIVLGDELGTIYSNSELSKLVEITARHRPESLKTDTASIMKGALELNKKHVKDVYTEMKNVFWLNEEQILSFDVLTKIFKLGHSRIPIFRVEGDEDDIGHRPLCVGLLYVKDLILVDPDDNIPITKVLETFDHHRLPIDVWRTDNLQTCMQTFIETCQHLAFVKDKDGDGVEYVGIITLEDVIEEILKKELVDEYDNYVDHLDHKSSTHRLNEINWESVAEIGEAVDAENARAAKRNTRKNGSQRSLRRKDTMVDMKPMPVSGHSRWPQMMTVTQPFMMKRGGQMSKTMQSHVVSPQKAQEMSLNNTAGSSNVEHPLYFAINTTSKQGHYGHQNRILNCIIHLQLEIIDFRSWHDAATRTRGGRGSAKYQTTQDCFYVQDTVTSLPPTRHLKAKQKALLKERVREIRAALAQALSGKASVSIKRWLPGVAKKDDTDGVSSPKTTEFDPQDAFKQAHSIMSNFEAKQAKAERARLAGGTEVEESRKARSSRSQKGGVAGAMQTSVKYGHPVGDTSGNVPTEDWDEEADGAEDEEMSYIYGDEDSQHQKLAMIEASESSSYGTLDDEAERSETTDSRRAGRRGLMSDTEDEMPENAPERERQYSIQISPPKGPPSMLVVKSSSACNVGDDEPIKGDYL